MLNIGLLNFFVASHQNLTFKAISKAYLKGFFLLDFLATIPPMVTLQQNKTLNLLKFLRFAHIGEMFLPFKQLIDCLMSNTIAKKRSDMFQLIIIFSAAILFGHIAACLWMGIGA